MDLFSLPNHRSFFNRLRQKLPEEVHSSYMTALFFTISGLNLLDDTSTINKPEVIDWIYSQQICIAPYAGFRPNPSTILPGPSTWDYASLASTYSALCILKILGDDLSRVCKSQIIESIRGQINEDGSVNSHPNGVESDMRFVYCACAVCYILDDWEGINKDLIERFILDCQTYEANFGLSVGMEGHGGATYCAVSSLYLLGKIGDLPRKEELVEWLVMRQGRGFQGRIGKAEDTCYGYWIGFTLKILGAERFINYEGNLEFYRECESPIGGYSKYPGIHPDPTHSYLGLCCVSLLGEKGLKGIFPPLGIPLDREL